MCPENAPSRFDIQQIVRNAKCLQEAMHAAAAVCNGEMLELVLRTTPSTRAALEAVGKPLRWLRKSLHPDGLTPSNGVTRLFFPIGAQQQSPHLAAITYGSYENLHVAELSPHSKTALLKTRELVDSLYAVFARHCVNGYELDLKKWLDGFARVIKLLESRARNREVKPFPTPDNVTWSQLSLNFIDGETVRAQIDSVNEVFNCVEMGMAKLNNRNPTVQWKLLHIFANHHGTLTWQDPEADPKNRKRQQQLARHLKSFFRIQGDPIVVFKDEKNRKGWKTVFKIKS